MTQTKRGLVLTGGGARAAYQAGVLRAISDIYDGKTCPFGILAGVSAGAINAVFLAAYAQDFKSGCEALWNIWAKIQTNRVFFTGALSLGRISLNWMTQLSMGGLVKGHRASYLLDTAPLRELLQSTVNFDLIKENISAGVLDGLAVSATNYLSGTVVSFFEGSPQALPWQRSTRIGKRAPITVEHVMASAAIPIFFPPVRLQGSYFGDGCIRFGSPLSPAIHLGADKVMAIGIRHNRSEQKTLELNQMEIQEPLALADIVGVLLNAVFLDSLDTDVERMERINNTVALVPVEKHGEIPSHLRKIPILAVRPSTDLGNLAARFFHEFPSTIRYLLRGIGASDEKGSDLLSYLAFDGSFTAPLLELGYKDAMARKDDIKKFLTEP